MRHCTTLLKIQLFCTCCILFIQHFCKSIKKAIKSNWQYSLCITRADDCAQSHCCPGQRTPYKKGPIVTVCTFTPQRPLSRYQQLQKALVPDLCSHASAENSANSMCSTVAITSCQPAEAAAFSCLAAPVSSASPAAETVGD